MSLLRASSADGTRIAPGRLPTFLIIGGMKAGTTSLYHYVRAHPQVYMPPVKALEFFAGGPHWDRGVEWYRKQFAAAPPEAVAVGEASNAYAKYPRFPGVPARIAELIPEARLLYLVRDPIERIRSHYQTRLIEGRERLPLERAVMEDPIYLDYSRYALQVEQYLEHFPLEQLLVLRAEDLRARRRDTMEQIYAFLGVDGGCVPADLDREFHRSQDRPARSLVPLWARKTLKKRFPAAKRAKELEGNVLRALRRLRPGAGATDRPAPILIPDELRERLVEALADDVRRLRGIIGPAFDGWGIA